MFFLAHVPVRVVLWQTNSGSTLISINPFELIPNLYTLQTADRCVT